MHLSNYRNKLCHHSRIPRIAKTTSNATETTSDSGSCRCQAVVCCCFRPNPSHMQTTQMPWTNVMSMMKFWEQNIWAIQKTQRGIFWQTFAAESQTSAILREEKLHTSDENWINHKMQNWTVINFYQNMVWNNIMKYNNCLVLLQLRICWGQILVTPNQQGLHTYKPNMPPIITSKSGAYSNDMFEIKTFSSWSTDTTCNLFLLMLYSGTRFQKRTVRPILVDKENQHRIYVLFMMTCFLETFFNTSHWILKKVPQTMWSKRGGPVGDGYRLGCSGVHASQIWRPLQHKSSWFLRSGKKNRTNRLRARQDLLRGAHNKVVASETSELVCGDACRTLGTFSSA